MAGSYLNACIMHRYFTQVRNNALEIMNKAYSQNRESPYPVEEVMRLLAFQTEEQTINFLEAHGLNVSGADVYFSRSDFFQPDFVINAARSLTIIEAKNTSLIGEVVNGGPLPPNLRHRPSSSFDKNGRFSLTKIKNGDDDSDPHEDVKVTVTKSLPFSVSSQSSPTKTIQEYSHVEVRDVARDLFVEVINETAREVSEDVLNGMQRLEEVVEEVADNILVETTTPLMGVISERVLTEVHQEDELEIQQKRLERERHMQEIKDLTNQLSTDLYQETLEAVLHEEVQQTILTEIRAFQREQQALKIEQAVTSLGEEYLDEAIHNLIQETSRDVFEEELRLRDEALAEMEGQVHLLQQSRFLKIWQKAFVKRLRFKDTIETFPSGPSTVGISEQLKEFHLLPKQQGYNVSSPQSILAQQKGVALSILKYHHQRYLDCKSLWGAFDLAGNLGQCLLDAQGCKDHILWKLVVSLPSSAKSQEFGLFCSWLKSKLRRGFIPEKLRKITPGDGVEIETCSLYKTRISSGQSLASICTKVVSGILPGPGRDSHTMGTIRDALLGCHGLVLVLENQGNQINDKAYWQEQNRRLLHLLYSKPKHPKVPLLIYSIGDDITPAWQNQCHSSLGLSTLQAEGYISEILFKSYLGSLQENKLCDKVIDDLRWLASQCPCPPILESLALSEYVDMGLTSFFSLPIRENERLRRRAKIKEETFNPVINLYNAVIQHLCKCCSGNQLKTLNWPPSEFAKTENESDLPSPEWNDSANLTELHNIISSLSLPLMEDYDTDSWEETREQCLFYVKSLPGSPHEKVPLISRVKWLLKRCERDYEEVCHQNYQTEGCTPRSELVPWTSLAETCVDYMVGLLKTRRDFEGDLTADRIVYFFQTDFDSFRQPQDWLQTSEYTLEDSVIHPKSIDDSYLISVEERRHDLECENERQEQNSEANISSRSFVQNLFDNIDHKKEVEVSAKRLDQLIAAEKEESQRFELYLKSLLDDTAIPESPSVNDKETTSESVQKEDMLLSDKMKELRSQLESSRRANRTAELRLQTMMNL
ncbi:Germinal-center associated nuclear protein [Holothuria leucospilota]|uniref:Germinal-center associated nuclear protein n=1 Tax=Holothuria leucospilota TaxID=206669 RepID=A0A9Q0YE62_HOLLE|nr:Germinal-center associated nuclear protein [Holothuria leucospilota]